MTHRIPNLTTRIFLPVLLIALVVAISPARAEKLTAEQIVEKTDYAMTHARDQYFEYDLITFLPNKEPKVLKFAVTIMGDKKRRLEFLAPGDIKGMRFLILDVDQMYVYMPAYKKVRRVASHVKSQGFMGSAYANDDMSLTKFGEVFTPKYLGEDDKTWHIEFNRKDGEAYSYSKLKVKIRKDIHQPVDLEYFNEKGMKVKSEIREGWKCKDDLCNPRLMTMLDHTRGDLKSQMVQRAWKPNTGVKERFFTVRSLQRR